MKFMDMLYHRYACPMDLLNSYINRGQFGKFVSSFLEAEYERRKEEVEKNEEMKLWIMYCHSYSEKSYRDWKADALKISTDKRKRTADVDLTDEGIKAIYADLFNE